MVPSRLMARVPTLFRRGSALFLGATQGRFRAGRLAPAVVLLAAVSLVSACSAAGETEAAANSKLAGIALPAGAQRILDAKSLKESTAPLTSVAAQLDSSMRMQATEVLAWGGPGYQRQKGAQVIGAVQSALQKAGLQTHKVGEPQDVQGNTLSFFVAGSVEKKKALVGYWLEGEQVLLLSWGEFGPGDPPRAPAPGAAPRNEGAPAVGSPGNSALPRFPKLTAKPNQATGVVLNLLGQPVPSARIRFWRLTSAGAIIEYVARTNAEGIYTLSMPAAEDYRLDNATALVTYGVQRYYLPLRPEGDDGTFFDRDPIDITKGYVKNFVLPISGHISPEEDPKEELSYYGGALRFRANIKLVIPNDPDPALTAGANRPNAVPEGTEIQLTLTPQGPLLDGSAGRPLQWSLKVRNTGGNAFSTVLKDIPLGTYTASVRAKTPDGKAFTPSLSARIVVANGISSPFSPSSEQPLFFAPRWEDWPMANGSTLRGHRFVKRSNQGGTGSVWLEVGD